VPYFWSDQYDLKIHAYGYLRDHDEAAVVDGGLAQRRFVVAYRTGDRLAGVLSAGMPPKLLRSWRQAVAAGTPWSDIVVGRRPSEPERPGDVLHSSPGR
jgi:hypothetical protein